MSLYFMITITDRNMSRIYRSLYEQHGVSVAFRTVGRGTAASEVLDYLGLERAEKAVIFSIVTGLMYMMIAWFGEPSKRPSRPSSRSTFPAPASPLSFRSAASAARSRCAT